MGICNDLLLGAAGLVQAEGKGSPSSPQPGSGCAGGTHPSLLLLPALPEHSVLLLLPGMSPWISTTVRLNHCLGGICWAYDTHSGHLSHARECGQERSNWSCCTWQTSSGAAVWNMLCPVSGGLQEVEGRHAEEAYRLLLLRMHLQNNCVQVPGGSEQGVKWWLLLTKQNFCVLGAQLSLWALGRGGQRDGEGLLLPPDIQKGPGFI